MRLKLMLCLHLVSGGLFSCHQPQTETIALVGGEKITAVDLRNYVAPRQKGAGWAGAVASATSDPLQQLIARRLLLLEARDAGMADDSAYVARLQRQRRDRVIEFYLERQVDAKIALTDEEILQEFYDANWHRGLKFVFAIGATKGAAAAGIQAQESAAGLAGYVLKNQVNTQVAEPLFALSSGSISPALPLMDKGDTVFVVFKVLDEKPVPLIAVEKAVKRDLHNRIRAKMTRALKASLSDKYAIDAPKDNPSHFPQLDSLSLLSVRPDRVNISDLLFSAGLQNGFDQIDEIQKKISAGAEDLLLSYYCERILGGISSSEARIYYERHPDQFPVYESVGVTEIVVGNRRLAQDLRRGLERGADPDPLALIFSEHQRSGTKGARVELTPYTIPSVLYERTKGAGISAVVGPVEWARGFSVFVLLDRKLKGEQWDRTAQKRAETLIREAKIRRHLQSLKEKYPVQLVGDLEGS